MGAAIAAIPACATTPTGTLATLPNRQGPLTGAVGPMSAPGGPFLDDRFGRSVLLHGADLVYKVPPYEVVVQGRGPNVLTDPEAQRMATLGFDTVRLGIIWKGLEPGTAPSNDPSICAPGTPSASPDSQFNASVFDSYLSRLDATIALLAKHGIYSLLDMHQDVYNEAFAGEGAPDWAVCSDGFTPQPKRNVPDWSVNLKGPGVVQAYEHFWRNDVVGNLQGAFDDIWAMVASHYRNNPWVLGYDPFNEPYGQGLPPAGSGVAFDGELQCFYVGRAHAIVNQLGQPVTCPPNDPANGVISRIEDGDPVHLVFYEPNYTTDSSIPSELGPMPFPRLVLNTHDYCILHVPNGPERSDFGTICGPLENATFTERNTERARDATLQQPGGPPLFLTEFGATTDAADLARVTGDADAHLDGWMYWQWLHYADPTGSHTSGLWPPTRPTAAMLQVLSRPYATAVAGTPLSMSFDSTTDRFAFKYHSNPHITEPTVIFLPQLHYGGGYCTDVTGGHMRSVPGTEFLDVSTTSSGDVSVTIRPGSC